MAVLGLDIISIRDVWKTEIGLDSVFKNRTVQKICSDGFLTETACNPPFK